MKLQWIVRAEADIEPSFEEVWQRISLVSQEKSIIAQRAHRDPNLFQVKQILKSGYFSQQDAMRDGMRGQERGCQMIGVSCLAAVRSEN